ncbi:hypothetical protein [Clostridium transplantifaecale]|uniref:hypothetical protein n=1 Tax=Clostridium transplantifaecale TaxID=2479838 RepID=UPI000F62E3FF|nr:hypothetical protein [Clostridium transplantifaecale]
MGFFKRMIGKTLFHMAEDRIRMAEPGYETILLLENSSDEDLVELVTAYVYMHNKEKLPRRNDFYNRLIDEMVDRPESVRKEIEELLGYLK